MKTVWNAMVIYKAKRFFYTARISALIFFIYASNKHLSIGNAFCKFRLFIWLSCEKRINLSNIIVFETNFEDSGMKFVQLSYSK
jgi:hypothetical protein